MATRVETLDGVVPAIFPDRSHAEEAIAELQALGFADDECGVIVPDPEHHYLLDDGAHETLTGVAHGVRVGAPLGALGGLALGAVAGPVLGGIGAAEALLIGAPVGALWGTVVGAYLGLTGEVHHLEKVERRWDVPLVAGEVLVVVVPDRHRADAVCEVMDRHGARCVQAPLPS